MMTVGILRRGATDKEPETSPTTSVLNRCMRISVRSCISGDGRSGGGGDGSIGLRRRLGLSCVTGLLRDGGIGRARTARSGPFHDWLPSLSGRSVSLRNVR
jgi:hypothetical protein